MKESVYTLSFFLGYNEIRRGGIMTPADWVYAILIGYLLLMAILGINLKVIWITIMLKVRFYDFEDLYGRTFARILFVIIAGLVYLFHFVVMKSITSITLSSFVNI